MALGRRRYAINQQDTATAIATSANSAVIIKDMTKLIIDTQISSDRWALGAEKQIFFIKHDNFHITNLPSVGSMKRSSRLSNVKIAFDCIVISSRNCPDNKSPDTAKSVLFSASAKSRFLRPKALYPRQFT